MTGFAGGERRLSVALVVGFMLAVTLAIALGVWFFLRGRQAEPELRAKAAPQAQTGPTAIPVSFQCSACQKKLKVKATLTGMKVKCPQCGKAVLVP